MSAFINLTKNEYPRHAGDIALAQEDKFAPVIWVDMPEYDSSAQLCYEGWPALVEGVWQMTWIVRDLTPEEIEQASRPFDPMQPPM